MKPPRFRWRGAGSPTRKWAMFLGMALSLALAACNQDTDDQRREAAQPFPRADRPVAPIVSTRWADEETRDRLGEATEIMDRAGIKPGMTVADIGAGEGYYTVRLAGRVGTQGRVLAVDVMPEVIDALGRRITRENLANISVKLGTPEDPKLPAGSFDRVFMVHMYNEITEPYAFLWYLHPALKTDGEVIVVNADKEGSEHGIPPRLLICEFAAVGYRLMEVVPKPSAGGYLARFRAVGRRPDPANIVPCALKGNGK